MSDELKPCPFCGNNPTLRECNGGWIIECEHHGWNENGEALRNETIAGDVDMCSWGSTESAKAALIDAWNARAAVTDEQFATAVHDGEAWQRVRTCRPTPSIMNDVEHIVVQRVGSSEFQLKWPYQRCSECSADFPEGSRYCPGCGAKVVAK